MEDASTKISVITASETYPVRREVLRPGRPEEECFFEGDLDQETLHLGLFLNGTLAGIASFMFRRNDQFSEKIQYQLRGMAILQEHQGEGYGAFLLRKGEKLLQERHPVFTLWFNARESAMGFYHKYGYRSIGEPFMIPRVCMHILMYRHFPI